VWVLPGFKLNVGDVAGGWSGTYYKVKLVDTYVQAHRVVWELHNGPIPDGFEVDHEDTNKANNLIGNLRLATRCENHANVPTYASSTTKVKGLCFNKAQGAWMGQVQANGKRHTKSSVDRALVERWLIDKRKELHGEFTRHR
jgi:hypothetical protein